MVAFLYSDGKTHVQDKVSDVDEGFITVARPYNTMEMYVSTIDSSNNKKQEALRHQADMLRYVPTQSAVRFIISGAFIEAYRNPIRPDRALTRYEVIAILWKTGWPKELHSDALIVSSGESGWEYWLTSYNGCCLGLFQINVDPWLEYCGLQEREELFDPETNARCALEIIRYEESRGEDLWYNWCVRPDGIYC